MPKDILDLHGLQGDGGELFGAVTVSLNHQHQKVAFWYLLHYKHPGKKNANYDTSSQTNTTQKKTSALKQDNTFYAALLQTTVDTKLYNN